VPPTLAVMHPNPPDQAQAADRQLRIRNCSPAVGGLRRPYYSEQSFIGPLMDVDRKAGGSFLKNQHP
jgi:hypothetical protein